MLLLAQTVLLVIRRRRRRGRRRRCGSGTRPERPRGRTARRIGARASQVCGGGDVAAMCFWPEDFRCCWRKLHCLKK